jgi:hypothetical protein
MSGGGIHLPPNLWLRASKYRSHPPVKSENPWHSSQDVLTIDGLEVMGRLCFGLFPCRLEEIVVILIFTSTPGTATAVIIVIIIAQLPAASSGGGCASIDK